MPPGRLTEHVNLKDALSGLALVLVAAWFGVTALRRLALGSLGAMGPGYFPLAMALGLGILGLAIVLRSIGKPTEPGRYAGPRAVLCILSAPLLFAASVGPLGFVPAVSGAALVSAYGSRLMTLPFALALTAALTGLATLLFVQLLRMPVSLFGPALGF
jgi:hypothetical protein